MNEEWTEKERKMFIAGYCQSKMENRWILVSEAMPGEDNAFGISISELVQVTVEDENGVRFSSADSTISGEWCGFYDKNRVIAWKPLDEYWKGEE